MPGESRTKELRWTWVNADTGDVKGSEFGWSMDSLEQRPCDDDDLSAISDKEKRCLFVVAATFEVKS